MTVLTKPQEGHLPGSTGFCRGRWLRLKRLGLIDRPNPCVQGVRVMEKCEWENKYQIFVPFVKTSENPTEPSGISLHYYDGAGDQVGCLSCATMQQCQGRPEYLDAILAGPFQSYLTAGGLQYILKLAKKPDCLGINKKFSFDSIAHPLKQRLPCEQTEYWAIEPVLAPRFDWRPPPTQMEGYPTSGTVPIYKTTSRFSTVEGGLSAIYAAQTKQLELWNKADGLVFGVWNEVLPAPAAPGPEAALRVRFRSTALNGTQCIEVHPPDTGNKHKPFRHPLAPTSSPSPASPPLSSQPQSFLFPHLEPWLGMVPRQNDPPRVSMQPPGTRRRGDDRRLRETFDMRGSRLSNVLLFIGECDTSESSQIFTLGYDIRSEGFVFQGGSEETKRLCLSVESTAEAGKAKTFPVTIKPCMDPKGLRSSNSVNDSGTESPSSPSMINIGDSHQVFHFKYQPGAGPTSVAYTIHPVGTGVSGNRQSSGAEAKQCLSEKLCIRAVLRDDHITLEAAPCGGARQGSSDTWIIEAVLTTSNF